MIKTTIKLILLLFLGSCASSKNAKQNVIPEYTLQSIAKSFDAKNLNYIGLAPFCNGGSPEPKMFENNCPNCYVKIKFYFFWTENEKAYIQKFDNCSEFNIVEILDFNTNTYLENNTAVIQKEEVKQYQKDKESYLTVSHYCSRSYILNDGELKYEKRINSHDLTGENDNINFKTNNALQLIQLDKKLNEIILGLENESMFIRNTKTCCQVAENK